MTKKISLLHILFFSSLQKVAQHKYTRIVVTNTDFGTDEYNAIINLYTPSRASLDLYFSSAEISHRKSYKKIKINVRFSRRLYKASGILFFSEARLQ